MYKNDKLPVVDLRGVIALCLLQEYIDMFFCVYYTDCQPFVL